MGYEIKMIVGYRGHSGSPEFEEDPSKPFDDGSGFECKKDEHGQFIKTGRLRWWFCNVACIDLCKLGYQDDSLNRLIQSSHKVAKENTNTVFYFYSDDGNTAIEEDRYGCKMWPVGIKEVLAAMEESHPSEPDEYRRTKWAKALLSSMRDERQELEVLFFGH